MKEECFQIAGKPHLRACGEFWNLRGQHNWQKKKKRKKRNLQNICLTTTASREVAQKLVSTTSEERLDRKMRAECLG